MVQKYKKIFKSLFASAKKNVHFLHRKWTSVVICLFSVKTEFGYCKVMIYPRNRVQKYRFLLTKEKDFC